MAEARSKLKDMAKDVLPYLQLFLSRKNGNFLKSPILFIWPWYFHAVHICLQRVLHRAAPDDHFNKCHMHTTKEYSVTKEGFKIY